ncbi:hypothetical protein [Streptomyces sp. NPDC058371]|uniref:hypothetical protein n=1 Tax=Streptomyces sp. NPDC058371 TaxID=3346463 RepID=UPI00364C71C1
MNDSDDDVLNLPRPAQPAHEIAVLGGTSEDDFTIACGYAAAAETTARSFLAQPDDGLVIPTLYLYRHSIELTLKWLIRLTARCALRCGYDGDENLRADKVNKKLQTHNIKKLAERLNTYVGHLDGCQERSLDSKTMSVLVQLDSEDEYGDAYRYALIGNASNSTLARPVQENVQFYEKVNSLHRLTRTLQDGYATVLHEYEQIQLGM